MLIYHMKGGMKMKKILAVAFVLALLAVASLAVYAAVPSLTIPGVNAKDDLPKGCLDCHVKSGSSDMTILTGMKKLIADKKHPAASDKMISDMAGCATCHKAGAKAGSLGSVIHQMHFAGGTNNAFVKSYSGNCTWCHSVDLTNGAVGVKGK